jgi:hypothetical protein
MPLLATDHPWRLGIELDDPFGLGQPRYNPPFCTPLLCKGGILEGNIEVIDANGPDFAVWNVRHK